MADGLAESPTNVVVAREDSPGGENQRIGPATPGRPLLAKKPQRSHRPRTLKAPSLFLLSAPQAAGITDW